LSCLDIGVDRFLSSRSSPFTSTVICARRSQRATAVVTAAMLRTLRRESRRHGVEGSRSDPSTCPPRRAPGLPDETPFRADFAGHEGHSDANERNDSTIG